MTLPKISIVKNIEPFLFKNGLQKMEPCGYANDLCNVVIQDDCFAVSNNYGDVVYSDNHNIYWLVGYLTWMGLIRKDYRQ